MQVARDGVTTGACERRCQRRDARRRSQSCASTSGWARRRPAPGAATSPRRTWSKTARTRRDARRTSRPTRRPRPCSRRCRTSASSSARPIVVKVGGSVGDEGIVLDDVVWLKRLGINPVLVHGGGPQISQAPRPARRRDALRRGPPLHRRATLEVVHEVLMRINGAFVVVSQRAAKSRAWGCNGLDGEMLRARLRDERLGLVGEVEAVNLRPIVSLVDRGLRRGHRAAGRRAVVAAAERQRRYRRGRSRARARRRKAGPLYRRAGRAWTPSGACCPS